MRSAELTRRRRRAPRIRAGEEVVATSARYAIVRDGRSYAARFALDSTAGIPELELNIWTGPRGYLWFGPAEGNGAIGTIDLKIVIAALEKIRRIRAARKR